ncbi:MAG: flagellar export chaperone FliS [Myxococcota bacterium]|nr:flagellar export chaperone FliS [Myxococcota bacterium]
MYRSNVGRYKQNKVVLSTPEEILIALYDGAIKFSKQARVAIDSGDTATKGQKLGGVMAILTELSATLEHSRAPELCENLARLYDYMIDRLQTAGLRMDIEPLDEVIGHLEKLRATWVEAIEIAARERKGEQAVNVG